MATAAPYPDLQIGELVRHSSDPVDTPRVGVVGGFVCFCENLRSWSCVGRGHHQRSSRRTRWPRSIACGGSTQSPNSASRDTQGYR